LLLLTKTEFKQLLGKDEMTFSTMRKYTLLNLKARSNRIKESENLIKFTVIKEW